MKRSSSLLYSLQLLQFTKTPSVAASACKITRCERTSTCPCCQQRRPFSFHTTKFQEPTHSKTPTKSDPSPTPSFQISLRQTSENALENLEESAMSLCPISYTPFRTSSTTFQEGAPEPGDTISHLKLAFVNRKESAYEVLQLLKRNTTVESLSDYTLPLVLQHYGSGKTSFARNLVPLFQLCENGTSWLLHAHYVYVDLRTQPSVYLKSTESPDLDATGVLLKITVKAICRSLSAASMQSEAVKEFEESAYTWESFYAVVKRHKLRLLLGFDEVDGLQYDLGAKPVMGWPVGTDKESRTRKAKIFLHFLATLLAEELHKSSISIVVCGKSAELREMSRENKVSPFNVRHIILPPFTSDHIRTLITQSAVSTNSRRVYRLGELIERSGYTIEEFSKELLIYTGGIPRPVELTLRALVDNYGRLPSSVAEFFNTLAYIKQKEVDLRLNPDSVYIYACVYLARYEIGVPLYATFTTPEGALIVYEMIEQTHVYYYHRPTASQGAVKANDEEVVVHLRIPKFTLMYFHRSFEYSTIVTELSNLKIYHDEGGFFEYVWLVRLASHQIQAAAMKSTWASLPGSMFEHVFCKNETMPHLSTGYFKQVPAMGRASATSLRPSHMSEPWKYKLKPTNRSFLWVLDKFVAHNNTFLIPGPKSSSQDLTFALNKKRIIAYQLKFLKEGAFGVADLVEEVEKVAILVKTLEDVALMVICTGYSSELTTLIGTQKTVLLKRNQEHIIAGTNIKLPSNMDVILVSEASLKLFLGGEALTALKQMKTKAKLLAKEELSLFCSALSQLSSKPVHEVTQFINEISLSSTVTNNKAALILIESGYNTKQSVLRASPAFLIKLGVAPAVVDFIETYKTRNG